MENSKKSILFIMVISAFGVLVCGIYGYSAGEQYDLINAVWYSVKLFFGDAGPYSENLFVNIAKFGALIISASFVISLVNKLSDTISDYVAWKKGNSIYVFGDSDYSREFITGRMKMLTIRYSLPLVNLSTSLYVLPSAGVGGSSGVGSSGSGTYVPSSVYS